MNLQTSLELNLNKEGTLGVPDPWWASCAPPPTPSPGVHSVPPEALCCHPDLSWTTRRDPC